MITWSLTANFFHKLLITLGLFMVTLYITTYSKFFCQSKQIFKLTQFFVTFVMMIFSSLTGESKQTKFSQVFKSILKDKMTFFGKFLSTSFFSASRSYFFPLPSFPFPNPPWNFLIFYINYTKYIEIQNYLLYLSLFPLFFSLFLFI